MRPADGEPNAKKEGVCPPVEQMTHRDALIAMFPDSADDITNDCFRQRIRWTPWVKPKISRPVDDSVKQLIDRKRKPCLRPKDELQSLGAACPYFLARMGIVDAVDLAKNRLEMKATWQENLACVKAYEAQIKPLIAGLRAFRERFNNSDVAPFHMRGTDQRDFNAYNDSLKRSNTAIDQIDLGIRGLDTIATLARAESERLSTFPDADGDIWIGTFIEALCHLWRALTEQNPSSSSLYFISFAQNAYASLDPVNERTWEARIRSAVGRVLGAPGKGDGRPPHDRFDAWEKRRLPLGTRVSTIGEFTVRQKHRAASWENEMRELCDATRSDNPQRRAAAKGLLAWSYSVEGPSGRKFIESLGWRSPPAPQSVKDEPPTGAT